MSSEWVHNASPEVNAQSQWHLIFGVCVSLTTIMVITVSLRMYVRGRILHSLDIDDYVIMFSAESLIPSSGRKIFVLTIAIRCVASFTAPFASGKPDGAWAYLWRCARR
jgi:hypothetical protein